MSGETPLAARLKAQIRAEGPLRFDRFMEAALYDEALGYYARGPAIGPDGDFSTSVSFQAFREAVLRLARAAHEALGAPDAFRFVELGAGTGQLARHVTERWPGLDYVTVDASAGLRARQAAVRGVRAVPSAEALAPAPTLVFGNEVLDALPVRRIVGGGGAGLLEVHVDLTPDGRFRDRLLPVDDSAVARRLERIGIEPQRGQVLDLQLGLDAFVHAIARLPDPGFVVLVDYGDPAGRLYAPERLNGTLAAYRAHGKFHDPYERVGEQDLTADVDWTSVALAAQEAGLEVMGLTTQGDWLEALGIHDLGVPDEAAMLAGATHLGSAFQVLALRRGTAASLPGFPRATPAP